MAKGSHTIERAHASALCESLIASIGASRLCAPLKAGVRYPPTRQRARISGVLEAYQAHQEGGASFGAVCETVVVVLREKGHITARVAELALEQSMPACQRNSQTLHARQHA